MDRLMHCHGPESLIPTSTCLPVTVCYSGTTLRSRLFSISYINSCSKPAIHYANAVLCDNRWRHLWSSGDVKRLVRHCRQGWWLRRRKVEKSGRNSIYVEGCSLRVNVGMGAFISEFSAKKPEKNCIERVGKEQADVEKRRDAGGTQ